ncbi:hypothetical protein HRI_000775700 [Hibiscus trionum]|uniref:Uncharacterized protein n=1 Tax=Hibiscus trionum TaxID=183268 RepID=A0A9W7H4T7_HIBTR|nr:hypothetical protein HRI_000775700 [Hibiscus trionum]
MKVDTLKEMCKHELGAYISYISVKELEKECFKKRGYYVDEYVNIWGYAAELLRSNPGSTISIQVHIDNENKAIFHKMYTCFTALKKG